MTVAVIGTGNVGGTLGRAFARAGMDVRLGSRDPAASTAAGDSGAKVTAVDKALDGVDVVVVALPGNRVVDFLRTHAAAVDRTLIVDAANRIGDPALNSAADVAAIVPGARYARAFNTYGWEVFAGPDFDGQRPHLLYTADEADRASLEDLIEAVGLRPMYVGSNQAEVLDAAFRMVFPMFRLYGRHLALQFLAD
jgi:8-hydroxy-5-deazaflavin:NADPH oxidoreductase